MDPRIFALTSLSPAHGNVSRQNACIGSWRRAGLDVRAFNHPSEIAAMREIYDVDFIPVTATAAQQFNGHYIPINTMLDWSATQDSAVLIINSDIELRLAPWQIARVRWLSNEGLCYFIRYNHDGNSARASREPHGLDAFLLHGRDAGMFAPSFLCMGQPGWDYWLPHTFVRNGRGLYSVEFPAAFHRNHQQRWSWDSWQQCARELRRVGSIPVTADPVQFGWMRNSFDANRAALPPKPIAIRDWLERRFGDAGPKLLLELGSHCGTDTAWMAALPGVTIHAFEPDPRNVQPAVENVYLHRSAVGDIDGTSPFILSRSGWGQEWTYSSSIKAPKNHLSRYPVVFGETIEVPITTLDTFCRRHDIDVVDFIWADVQGAEGEMIRGGIQTLQRTRYLYTEYSNDEMYEGQVTLADILKLLPQFRVIELWPDDVLLENQALR